MFLIPFGDAGGGAAQTVIPPYGSQTPIHLERVVPHSAWNVVTAIGELSFDLSSLKLPTRIEPNAASRPAVLGVSPLEELTARLDEYLSLQADWDGEGGVAPAPKAIFDAEQFVRALPADVALPKPMVGGDGTVGLYWRLPDAYAEATFTGTGDFTYFIQRGQRAIMAANIALRKAVDIDDLFALAA